MDFSNTVPDRVDRFRCHVPGVGSKLGRAGEGRFDADRAFALVAALGAHVALALMMMQPHPSSTSRDDVAFDVIFIERVPPAIESPVSEERKLVARSPGTATMRRGMTAEMVPRTTQGPAEPATTAASSIPETTADDRWDIPAKPVLPSGMSFHDNPLERPLALQPPVSERFRMRPERSPAAMVQGVARLVGLWPPGYTDDPCPQISRNVELLAQSTDPASRRQLSADLELERRYCR
jgi:hypothetical protein